MPELERSFVEKSMYMAGIDRLEIVRVAHWQTVQAARLFQCQRAASNAVNAYPMLNLHGIYQKNAWLQAVRIRHLGRHKCRATALAGGGMSLLIDEMKG